MDTLEAFNRALFLAINGTLATPVWLVDIASLIANYVIYLVPLLLAGMWLCGSDAQRSLAIRACLVAMLGVGANQLIGLVWQHPRPFMIGLGHTFLAHAPDSSFPSDHATVFAGIVLTLLLGRAHWLGVLTLLAGVSVAWARIFLGVHFPLDMLGGVVVACVAYFLVAPFWDLGGAAVTQWAIALYRKLLAWPIDLGWLRR
ncbi:phosphatase PAP2 family protein [Paraburkholderia fungorum]|uniref:Undecaprenyl-diphosphatase n=1 Tax=Paraburkholderia fungorum TaxID=134537 RepID=A0AAW3V906_9BURK|nr:phosphatase PAP2 family protein [Paraburkholderia fungorum]KFX64537.1 PA-phosphatase [Burkholderia sp. K24]MBB4519795.1 undecaprenyl-diphosphatase [Paraburkholderia fungorum]MBB6207459.1 undecaprenyl-diphosphatase [Paraburkholderia fungorum]USX07251.1 phosphatase PAP2 family protein [Paraburkholderia fungorum]